MLKIKISKGGKTTLYKINYNKKDDKFYFEGDASKNIIKIVHEFNFHRDVGLLYESLLKFT